MAYPIEKRMFFLFQRSFVRFVSQLVSRSFIICVQLLQLMIAGMMLFISQFMLAAPCNGIAGNDDDDTGVDSDGDGGGLQLQLQLVYKYFMFSPIFLTFSLFFFNAFLLKYTGAK